jgi:hypothetical protein
MKRPPQDGAPQVRRSAGMRENPSHDAREYQPIAKAPPKSRTEGPPPQRGSESSTVKQKPLMGEGVSPRGLEIGRQREAFRAFMIARHLRPSQWAKSAGIPAGEILAFLTGRASAISFESLGKLAQAAGCEPQDFFADRRSGLVQK